MFLSPSIIETINGRIGYLIFRKVPDKDLSNIEAFWVFGFCRNIRARGHIICKTDI